MKMKPESKSRKTQVVIISALLALLVFFVLGLTDMLWAEYATHNRPNPLMDYVSQEIGIYDTVYWELDESDCRGCHGNSLADRHHLSDSAVVYGLCTPCHEVIPEPPFVVVTRDCVTSGCHSWDDVDTNGWHHNMDQSSSSDCTCCHDPNLIDKVSPVRDFETYPPTIVTPTLFSCENCHWGQDRVPGGGPDDPGHPSTYDHYDMWGNFVGFHEYSNPIYDNFHTHHMGLKGDVYSECYQCHGSNPLDLDWDPYNPEIIRYCERCHSAKSLHGISPHLQYTNGWEAIGFHVPLSNTQTRDVDPVFYRTWDPTGPYLPEMTDGFTLNQMCHGCHGDDVPDPPPLDYCTGNVPAIDKTVAGIKPNHGACGTIVTLRGRNYGAEYIDGRHVQMSLRGQGDLWTDMPIVSWANTRIEFQIPCLTLEAGIYKVKVKTECGQSNIRYFVLSDWIAVTSISPESGPCGQWITIYGANLGWGQSRIYGDGYHGIHRVVDFVSSQGTFTARRYRNWNNSSLEVTFAAFFEDGTDPYTGERNFIQDDGTGPCPEEPTIGECRGMALGVWSVYEKAIYFGDDDASGDLTCGDTIFQLVISDAFYFELTRDPEDPDDQHDPTNPDCSEDAAVSRINQSEGGKTCGCFIATAAFGSYVEAFQVLVGLRDHHPLTDPTSQGP